MSQRNGFSSGFILGSLVGGLVGGVLGTLLATRSNQKSEQEADLAALPKSEAAKISTEESIEIARRSLEDKIAQLNLAIDDVRQQLGAVNRNGADIE